MNRCVNNTHVRKTWGAVKTVYKHRWITMHLTISVCLSRPFHLLWQNRTDKFTVLLLSC